MYYSPTTSRLLTLLLPTCGRNQGSLKVVCQRIVTKIEWDFTAPLVDKLYLGFLDDSFSSVHWIMKENLVSSYFDIFILFHKSMLPFMSVFEFKTHVKYPTM